MITPKQTRKAARKQSERQIHQKRATQTLTGIMLTAVLAGVVSPAAFAATPKPETGTVKAVDEGDGLYAFSRDIGATEAETQELARTAEGHMSGTVKLSADAKQLKDLADKGIIIDIAASEQMTNKSITSGQTPIESSELLLSVKFNKAKYAAAAKAMGLTAGDEGFDATLSTMRGDQVGMLANIATDKTWGNPSFKEGQRLLFPSGEIAYASDPEFNIDDETGAYLAARLFPVASVFNGGVAEKGETTSTTSTSVVADPYSDGDSASRLADIASKNKRGLNADADNCITDNCAVWLTPSVNGMRGDTYVRLALADALRVNVETTVSAGKSPVGKSTLKSGTKVWFTPNAGSVDNFLNAASVAPWEFEPRQKADVKAIADPSVDVTSISQSKAGSLDVEAETNQSLTTSVSNTGGKVSLTLTAANEVDAWSNGGTALRVESTLTFGAIRAKVVSFDSRTATFDISSTKSGWTPGSVTGSDVAVISVGVGNYLPWYSLESTPTYTIHYEKALKPEPTPEPTPEPEPTPTPEPTPEPTPTPTPEPEKPKPTPPTVTTPPVVTPPVVTPPKPPVVVTPPVVTPPKPPVVIIEGPPVVIPKPVAKPDVKTGKAGEDVVQHVTNNDASSKGFRIMMSTLRLIDPETNEKVETYTVKAQGTYSVDSKAGTITFTPEKDFEGKADALKYVWTETNADGVQQSALSTVQAIITPVDNPDGGGGDGDDPDGSGGGGDVPDGSGGETPVNAGSGINPASITPLVGAGLLGVFMAVGAGFSGLMGRFRKRKA